MEVKFYRCAHCGNIAIKVIDSGVTMVCCGEPMVELVAGSTDAALEKHVPVVNVEGSHVHVCVGEVAHPMTEEHLIQFVVLATTAGFQVVNLSADDEPVADFELAEGVRALKAYEYCNLHGLWVKEI